MKCDELKKQKYCQKLAFGDEVYLAKIVDPAIAELKAKLDEYVLIKLSTQQMLQNLLDCGLIKEWYFNGKFNFVLKADDPHLQIKELKAKLEDAKATAYAESVDAGMRERKLRRALYKACAKWAHHRVFVRFNTNEKAWENMERKCLKKAEEYK